MQALQHRARHLLTLGHATGRCVRRPFVGIALGPGEMLQVGGKGKPLGARQRAHLLRVFDGLARLPHQEGDYRETGASGRIFEVKLIDETLVTLWTDHASSEVRIVRIEPAE